MITTFIHIIFLIFYIYLLSSAIYLLFLAIVGLFPVKKHLTKAKEKKSIVVLIPGYREDNVIIDVAMEALNQDYGTENYDVVIIADGFKVETLRQLEKLQVIVIKVDLAVSTKSRALNAALAQLKKQYDIAVVLDADNIMAINFLSFINDDFNYGRMAVQGHRVAKNMDTYFAVLDAVSEEMNNHLFRKAHQVLGLSSSLIGSAMAFDYSFFKEMMQKVEVVGGFDKEIEVVMLQKGMKIDYLPNAYVYDEKVPDAKVFTKQRRRWLSAQVHYFGKSFLPATKDLFLKGNIDFFNKAMQYLLPPRIMLLGAIVFFTVLSLFVPYVLPFKIWGGLFVITILIFLLSIPKYFYNFRTLLAITRLPYGFLLMVLSLLKIGGSNKEFLHTKHTYNAFQRKHHSFYKNKKS